MQDDQFEEEDLSSSSGGMSWVLPVVTTLMGGLAGVALGSAIVGVLWSTSSPEVEEVVKLRDLSDEELDMMCKPFVSETVLELTEAQAKVSSLKGEVAAKESRVKELEDKMKRGAVVGRKIRAELAAAKAELETLKEQLTVAVEEKEAALAKLEDTMEQLEETEEELVETKGKLVLAEEDVLVKRWTSFIQSAQLEVCEKGGRRKMGRCRESVQASLGGSVEEKFRHCLKSGQAVPGLFEEDKNSDRLPDFSQYLNQDDRVVRGWYIQLCDPTLPEAEDFSDALRSIQESEDGLDDLPLDIE